MREPWPHPVDEHEPGWMRSGTLDRVMIIVGVPSLMIALWPAARWLISLV